MPIGNGGAIVRRNEEPPHDVRHPLEINAYNENRNRRRRPSRATLGRELRLCAISALTGDSVRISVGLA